MRFVSYYFEVSVITLDDQGGTGWVGRKCVGKGSKSDRVLFFNMKFLVTGIQKAMQVQHIIRWEGD